MTVKHCPTESESVDFFIKPSQGNLFKFFINVVMGNKDVSRLIEFKSTQFEDVIGNRLILENFDFMKIKQKAKIEKVSEKEKQESNNDNESSVTSSNKNYPMIK